MLDRSKVLILAILVIAFSAASFAVWFRYQASRQTLALWGAEHAALIRNAPVVEAWRLSDANSKQPQDNVQAPDGQELSIVARRELQTVPDLSHIRKAFLDDVHFRWRQPSDNCTPQWDYVLQFRDGQRHATLWIDSACDQVLLEEAKAKGSMNPPILRSIRTRFLARYVGEPDAS